MRRSKQYAEGVVLGPAPPPRSRQGRLRKLTLAERRQRQARNERRGRTAVWVKGKLWARDQDYKQRRWLRRSDD